MSRAAATACAKDGRRSVLFLGASLGFVGAFALLAFCHRCELVMFYRTLGSEEASLGELYAQGQAMRGVAACCPDAVLTTLRTAPPGKSVILGSALLETGPQLPDDLASRYFAAVLSKEPAWQHASTLRRVFQMQIASEALEAVIRGLLEEQGEGLDDEAAQWALATLAATSRESASSCMQLLSDPRPERRAGIVLGIPFHRELAIRRNVLATAVDDETPLVRQAAIDGLRSLDPPSAVRILVTRLQRERSEYPLRSILSLIESERYSDSELVRTLVECLPGGTYDKGKAREAHIAAVLNALSGMRFSERTAWIAWLSTLDERTQ